MKINFSGNNMLISFNYFLSQVDFSNPTKLEISTSGTWLNVHPAALVFATALAHKIGQDNVIINNTAGQTGLYLDRMGLYQYSSTPSPYNYTAHEETGRFIPIRQITSQGQLSTFVADIVPLLHLDPDKSQIIKYVIGELIRNVLEHSGSSDGAFVAAQYRPRTKTLSFGVCDTGIGIKASLNKFHYTDTDSEAIRMALMPGVSGTAYGPDGSADNAGAGLFIVKNLSKMTRNYFVVYSGNAAYKLLKYDNRIKSPRIHADPFDDRHSSYPSLPFFNGTLVGVDITLNSTENFNNLMEIIKNGYSKAIRERKEHKYKKVKFS